MTKKLLVSIVVLFIAGVISYTLVFNNNSENNSNNLVLKDKTELNQEGQMTISDKTPLSQKEVKVYKSQVKNLVLKQDKEPIEIAQIEDNGENTKLEKKGKFIEEEGDKGKDNPNLFAEWYNGIRTKPGQERPDYQLNYQVKELLKAKNISNVNQLGKINAGNILNWQERGPGNVAGRTRGILVDPNDATYSTWYTGSVSGGVWKTTDAGQSWTNLTEDLTNLATSTLAWSTSDVNTIYVGTGEGFWNSDEVDGSGIWKSTDAGLTWNQLTFTATNPEFENIMRMAVDPATPNIIVAAVGPGFQHFSGSLPSSGIWKSTDGGTNWTNTYDAGGGFLEDLKADPTDFNIQYATVNSTAVLKSTDAGDTWFESDNGIAFGSIARMELAVSESDPNRIYISAEGGAYGSALYSSTDAGANWYMHEGTSNVNWLGAQGWYDNTIAVNPYDENVVYVGGIQLWQLDVVNTLDTSAAQIKGVDQENLATFLWFVNWGGGYAGGGLDIGDNFFGSAGLVADDYTTVEVRFGNGKHQKAHRFVYSAGNFLYQDYVDVPFEVWDTDHNIQLMASFRDYEGNGTFDLNDRASSVGGVDREYTFINAVPYDTLPDPTIAQTNGIIWKNTYAYWPEAPTGVSNVDFDAINFDAVLRINWGTFLTRNIIPTNITDSYGEYGGYSKGVHVDHHNIVLVKTDPGNEEFRLVNGNDGGVSFSDDKGETFSQTGVWLRGDPTGQNDVLLGYNTTQFYGLDKAPGVSRYIGGTQDNGSFYSPLSPGVTSSWIDAPSGDGFEAVWNYNDINKMMESSQFNSIYRTVDGGAHWTWIGSQVDYPNGPFFTRLAKSKQDPDLVFAISSAGVWRTDNFGSSWTLTTMPAGFSGDNFYSQIKISLVNPQIVWSARNMTSASPPYVSTDGGLTFNATNYYSDVSIGRISGFETHPTEENTAFALVSTHGTAKVLKTTDLGQTWVDISGYGTGSVSTNGFPDVAVYSLLVMPYNTDIIWAGTEIGIFESTDGGGHWAFANNGFPSVAVYDMLIVDNEIVVGTHGRGVWSVVLPELIGYKPPVATLSPRFVSVTGGAGGIINTHIKLPSAYDSTNVMVDGETIMSFPANSSVIDSSITLMLAVSTLDTVTLSLESYKDTNIFLSSSTDVTVFPLKAAQTQYANDFNQIDDDFVSNGFTVDTVAGFSDGAVHSPHPYPDAVDLTYILSIPIIVADEEATFVYGDVAIVEPGDPGTVFGDANFWDYVIVEGSTDNGDTWIPLLDGYDSRYDTSWTNAYNTSSPGDSTMIVTHNLNLLDTFDAGDEVIFRFRLFADGNTHGWGWVIDNLHIQDGVTGVKDGTALPTTYSLSQNYPNPFNPSTTIQFTIPKTTQVQLKVYDILGAEVATLMNTELKAGLYKVNWNASQLASGVYFYRITAGDFVETKKLMLLK